MWCFFKKLLDFLFPVEVLSGEVLVTGKDSFSINLPRHPKEVEVFFKEECNIVPCNPGHETLSWHVDHCGVCHHKLTVEWDVDGVRTIVWLVRY